MAIAEEDRIGEVLDTDPSVVPPREGVTSLPQHGRLELDDVSFTYPGLSSRCSRCELQR